MLYKLPLLLTLLKLEKRSSSVCSMATVITKVVSGLIQELNLRTVITVTYMLLDVISRQILRSAVLAS